MIKIDIEHNKSINVRIEGDAEDLAIDFSMLFEKLIQNGIPVSILAGALIQACCQGKLSDDEFAQVANTVTDMLEALADKYFDK